MNSRQPLVPTSFTTPHPDRYFLFISLVTPQPRQVIELKVPYVLDVRYFNIS